MELTAQPATLLDQPAWGWLGAPQRAEGATPSPLEILHGHILIQPPDRQLLIGATYSDHQLALCASL